MKSALGIAALLAVFLSTTEVRAAAPPDEPANESKAPSILLVTFDTVRADRLEALSWVSAQQERMPPESRRPSVPSTAKP